jgi:hypothetical protein
MFHSGPCLEVTITRRINGLSLGTFQKRNTVPGIGEIMDVKEKFVAIQAWIGPEGSRRLRLPYFKVIGK